MSETAEALAGRPVARMTEAEYEKERARLRDLHGDSPVQAAAKRDQAMALLFARSGWTQEELARKEDKGQAWIALRLRFGRFLNFNTTDVVNAEGIPNNLTEGRFRGYWERTDKQDTERQRFDAVREMITAAPTQRIVRPVLAPTIVKEFGDGEWHHLKDIASTVADGDEEYVTSSLGMMLKYVVHDAKAEKRKHGTSYEYRIFKGAASRVVALKEIRTKLGPLIKELKAEGKKNMATMSPFTVARIAGLLERQLDEWTK
jgi:hypothetical protein